MEYITKKRKEMGFLLNLIKSTKNKNVIELHDNIYYNENEVKMLINRVQRQIDGFNRIHANLRNNSITIKDYALIKALAIKEHEYFLEVENTIDSYTSTNILKSLSRCGKKNSDLLFMVFNLNKKIANRSKVESKASWIEDRAFEIGSVCDIVDFEFVSDSLYNINCLDSVMSGKISKEELVHSKLWREIHKDHTNSIYLEVGNLLREGKSRITTI